MSRPRDELKQLWCELYGLTERQWNRLLPIMDQLERCKDDDARTLLIRGAIGTTPYRNYASKSKERAA